MNRGKHQAGQSLVLFVGGMLGLLAIAALVVDLAMVYSLQRTERSAADAAALAGAQDLQILGSRSIDSNHQIRAVQDALNDLVARFDATGTAQTTASGSNCTPKAGSVVSVTDCALTGTPYWVTIKTPSPIALDVEPSRAVMVTVRQPDVPLTLARLLGQHDWNVGQTSVAGLAFGGQYAIITLRPPLASDRTGNGYPGPADITINGTTSEVVAIHGDIGMNTGATLNGHNAEVTVSDGYYIRYYGCVNCTDHNTPLWPSAYQQLKSLVPDPGYPVPNSASPGVVAGGVDTNAAHCTNEIAKAQANGYTASSGADLSGAVCYTPGIYSAPLYVANGSSALLEPGVYWFNGGVTNKGVLVGGYETNKPGVAIVVPQSQAFVSNGGGGKSANYLLLNRGSAWGTGTSQACTTDSQGNQLYCATPALMPDGITKIQTNTTPPMLMSVIVPGDPACPVVVPAPSCAQQTHSTVKWTGSGSATVTAVSGVVYVPSDNSAVAGNNDPRGYLGQLVAWTITYSGSSTLNQEYPGATPNGVLRLDGACSGGTSPCSP